MFAWRYNFTTSALFWLTLAVVFCTLAMKLIDNALVTSAAPAGIISFQLAGNLQQLNQIIAQWDSATQKLVMFQLGLDFLYLTIYSSFLYLVARRFQSKVHLPELSQRSVLKWFNGIPWLAICAGACDFVEDCFAVQLMFHLPDAAPEKMPQMISAVEWMWLFAVLKFIFLAVVFLYIIYYLIRYRMMLKR